jgi:hypothetical protein
MYNTGQRDDHLNPNPLLQRAISHSLFLAKVDWHVPRRCSKILFGRAMVSLEWNLYPFMNVTFHGAFRGSYMALLSRLYLGMDAW